MTEESGGAAPQRGFIYQAYVGAYLLITDDPDFLAEPPSEIQMERRDSDLYVKIPDEEEHYFEVKHKDKGEYKWGEFKNQVIPEFYRISQKYASDTDKTFFHLVVNTALADKIHGLAEVGKDIRTGNRLWAPYREQEGRSGTVKKMLDGIQSNGPVGNDDEVSIPDDPQSLHPIVWGLDVHAISQEEIESKLENYLRRVTPREHRKACRIALEQFFKKDGGTIRRIDIEEEIGTPLEPSDDSTSAPNAPLGDLRSDLEDVQQTMSNTEPNTGRLAKEQEQARRYSEQAKKSSSNSDVVVEEYQAGIDERYEKLKELDKERTAEREALGTELDQLLDHTGTSTNN